MPPSEDFQYLFACVDKRAASFCFVSFFFFAAILLVCVFFAFLSTAPSLS